MADFRLRYGKFSGGGVYDPKKLDTSVKIVIYFVLLFLLLLFLQVILIALVDRGAVMY